MNILVLNHTLLTSGFRHGPGGTALARTDSHVTGQPPWGEHHKSGSTLNYRF